MYDFESNEYEVILTFFGHLDDVNPRRPHNWP